MCGCAMLNHSRNDTYCATFSHPFAGPQHRGAGGGPLFGGVRPDQINGGRVARDVAPFKRGPVAPCLDVQGAS